MDVESHDARASGAKGIVQEALVPHADFERPMCGAFPPFPGGVARSDLIGSNAQKASFAKFGWVPDSGPSS